MTENDAREHCRDDGAGRRERVDAASYDARSCADDGAEDDDHRAVAEAEPEAHEERRFARVPERVVSRRGAAATFDTVSPPRPCAVSRPRRRRNPDVRSGSYASLRATLSIAAI